MGVDDSSTLSVEIIHPQQAVFTCPICNTSFSVYYSWTRHLTFKHPDAKVDLTFRCGECERAFDYRRSVSNHHSKIHGRATQPDRGDEAGRLICEFCSEHFPNKRSLGQHIRNQHMAEASRKRAAEWQARESTLWTTEEHQLFINALQELGPDSNVAIARRIPTKSAKQVGVHKRTYLRDHPEMRGTPTSPTPLTSLSITDTPPSSAPLENGFFELFLPV